MRSRKPHLALAGAVAVLTLVAACSRDDASSAAFQSEAGILRYVPADTPYLFATPGDLPDDVADKLKPQFEVLLQAYHDILEASLQGAMADGEESGEEVELVENMRLVVEELGELMSLEGLADAGIDRHSKIAAYGVGLVPVFRLTLSDGTLFEAALKRLEDEADQALAVATIGDYSYRYAGDDKGRLIIAVLDDELVVTAVPTGLPEDQLEQVLGMVLPEENIAAAGTVAALGEHYGYTDYLIGFIDTMRLVETFLDEQAGINAQLLSLMQYDRAGLTDACKAEIRRVAGVMPRVVTGYTDISVETISSKTIFELREDLAAGVATLTGTVPGLTDKHGALMSVGMSFDLLAARNFYEARLDALEAEPFTCDYFADLQNGVARGREALNQPVPPIVYGFTGFLAVIENLTVPTTGVSQRPQSADMRLLIGTNNAEGLLAMGAMFSPELAALDMQPDGEPVRLDLPQLAAAGQVVHAALNQNALAISMGEGMEAGLAAMLAADAPQPSPFLTADMDATRYYGLVGQQLQDADGQLPVQEAVADITKAMQEAISRISFDVYFTADGIEVGSTVSLAD